MERIKQLLLNDLDLKIRMGDILFNVLYINYEPPVPLRYFNTHSHSSYELHFIPKGKGILRISRETYPIEPGTFYLTGPDIYHEQIANSEDPMSEYCLNFEFSLLDKAKSKTDFHSGKETSEIKEILLQTNFWYGTDHFETWKLMEKAMEELEYQLLGYFTAIQSLITQVIVNAVRNYSNKKKVVYPFPQKCPLDKRREIADLFFRNYEKDLKPAVLARKLNVSVRQLERIMQQYYAMSFKDKLLSTRVEISKDLLGNTGQTVKEIAVKTGFSAASYFCRLFKERMGCTPTEYRKKAHFKAAL